MPPLSPETRRRLDALFPGKDRDEAARLLEEECGNNLPSRGKMDAAGMDRLRFAALKQSRGHLGMLKEAVQLAKIDWRDLLMAAGFGYDVDAHRSWEPR